MLILTRLLVPNVVLLEGSPGVGKTSLISAIGKFSGHKVVRINLSEQVRAFVYFVLQYIYSPNSQFILFYFNFIFNCAFLLVYYLYLYMGTCVGKSYILKCPTYLIYKKLHDFPLI